jgi:hypothetical protein
MDFNKLIARVKSILLTPKTEWPVIAGETATAGGLYTGYIMLLAAVPVICSFLKSSLIGYSVPFLGTMHIGMGMALSAAVTGYVLSLVGVYVVALIVNALAPNFGGQKDSVQALKVVTYSYTASWIAGIGMLIPGLGFLVLLAGLGYGIYLLYLGLPVTMKCPPEKATGYTAVTIIAAIVLYIVIGAVVGSIGGMHAAGLGGFGATAIERDGSSVTFDGNSAGGKLAQWAQGMEQAGKQLEAAQKSGDTQTAANAAAKVVASAVTGGAQVEALAPDRLKGFLPETLGGLKRVESSAERNGAMGMQVAEARARYADDAGGRSLNLEITDMGSAKGLMALASAANVEMDRQTETGYEKTYRQGGSMVHEQWDGASKHGEYSVVVAERFSVKLEGSGADVNALKTAISGVDLAGLAALKNEGVKAN